MCARTHTRVVPMYTCGICAKAKGMLWVSCSTSLHLPGSFSEAAASQAAGKLQNSSCLCSHATELQAYTRSGLAFYCEFWGFCSWALSHLPSPSINIFCGEESEVFLPPRFDTSL